MGVSLRIDEWLPEGWKVEVRVRKSGRRDKYYTCPKTGYVFRSLKAIDRYLLSGELSWRVPGSRRNNNYRRNSKAATTTTAAAAESSCINAKKTVAVPDGDNIPIISCVKAEGTTSKRKKLNPPFGEPKKKTKRTRGLSRIPDDSDQKQKLEKAVPRNMNIVTCNFDEPEKGRGEDSRKTEADSTKKMKKRRPLVSEMVEEASSMEKKSALSLNKPNKVVAVTGSRKQVKDGGRKLSRNMKKKAESELSSFFIQESDDYKLVQASSDVDRSDIQEIIEFLNRGDNIYDDNVEEDGTVYISAQELAALLAEKMQQPTQHEPQPLLVSADHLNSAGLLPHQGCYHSGILPLPPCRDTNTAKCEGTTPLQLDGFQGQEKIFTATTGTDGKRSRQQNCCDDGSMATTDDDTVGFPQLTFPFGYLCSDPCIDFAIKTLTGGGGVANHSLADADVSSCHHLKAEDYRMNQTPVQPLKAEKP